MRVLFDTNVVLDLLLDRAPFAEASEQILSRVETGELAGYLCATTITTIHYLAAKALGAQKALTEVRKLLVLFEIAPVNRPILENALESDFSDFEDSVLHEAALQVGADAIVTRNLSDFHHARLPAHSPEEMIRILGQQSQDG
ncbi:MAG: PIN domain-containing protein [Thermoanaerobaculia bacterium]